MIPGPILAAFVRHDVDFLLIGGMNFFLRHRPITTFDVDLWVNDEDTNLAKVNAALTELAAQWGASTESYAPIPSNPAWLKRQAVFCLTSQAGAIDIFRAVDGLESYAACKGRAVQTTQDGITFQGLSDADMLACQLALPEGERRLDRIRYLEKILKS